MQNLPLSLLVALVAVLVLLPLSPAIGSRLGGRWLAVALPLILVAALAVSPVLAVEWLGHAESGRVQSREETITIARDGSRLVAAAQSGRLGGRDGRLRPVP